jgi:exodeoxyribonuclease V beta subunit
MEGPRARARGLTITSYSRIKALRGGYKGPDLDGAVIEAPNDDVHRVPPELAARTELPAGAETGRFLHELLEVVSLDALRRGPISQDPESTDLFLRTLDRFGLSRSYFDHAADLVERAYLAPVSLEGRVIDGIASAGRIVREMEFLYPLSGSGSRTFIKGFIDLVFEHDGRVFVADWKSDLLPGYSAGELAAHVEENYRLQAELYTLAMMKHLGIASRAGHEERFGGVVYAFLRAMERSGDGTAGICSFRPSYEEALGFEASLSASDLEVAP